MCIFSYCQVPSLDKSLSTRDSVELIPSQIRPAVTAGVSCNVSSLQWGAEVQQGFAMRAEEPSLAVLRQYGSQGSW